MLSSQLIQTIRPLVTQMTPAQKIELIRWITEASHTTSAAEPGTSLRTWEARISEEAAAWYARPDADREPYAGQYVALLEGKVIAHHIDRVTLAEHIRERYPQTPVLITTAEARAPREFQMRPRSMIF